MAKVTTDITRLGGKKSNVEAESYVEENGIGQDEYIANTEWNTLIDAVQEMQDKHNALDDEVVKTIKRGSSVFKPENNQIELPVEGTDSDVLTLSGLDSNQFYKKDDKEVKVRFMCKNIENANENNEIKATLNNASNVSVAVVIRPVADASGYYTLTFSTSYLKRVVNTSDQLTFRVERTGDPDRYIERTLTFSCINIGLSLLEGYNFGRQNPSTITYIPTFTYPEGVSSIRLVVNVYKPNSTEIYRTYSETSVTTNNQVAINLDWNNVATGLYVVKAYLDMGNGLVTSDIVETELFGVSKADETSAYLVAAEPLHDVVLYEDLNICFAAYAMGRSRAMVRVNLNGNETTLEVPTGEVFRDYVTNIDQVNNVLALEILGEDGITTMASVRYEFTAGGTFTWRLVGGYKYNLTGKGRSNNESPTPANWGGIAEFTDFDWTEKGSGWRNSALHLIGSSKLVLNMYPFYSDTLQSDTNKVGGGILDTGRTIRARFKVSNVSSTERPIIHCWDGTTGFYITPDTIFARPGASIVTPPSEPQSSQNNRHYSPDEDMEVCITVQPYWDENKNETQHFVTLYINGQFAGDAILSAKSLSQTERLPITFEPLGCELDVSQVTYYEKCLTNFEVLQNYVMGLKTLDEMREAFDKNQCYTGNGIVSFNEAFQYCKFRSAMVGDSIEGTCNIIVNTYTFPPEISDTDAVAPGRQELSLLFFKNGEVDEDRSVKYVGEEDKVLRVRIQGSSTAKEFRKNNRYDYKGNKDASKGPIQYLKVYRWSKQLYEAAGSLNPDDGWYYEKDATKLEIYLRGNKSTENACKLLTVKANYNESTSARNLPMAKWTDDVIKYLGNLKSGDDLIYPELLSPPQRSDSKVRQCIDGLPAIQFTHTVGESDYVFSGKVDLITDKKNSSVFGFSESPYTIGQPYEGDYSIEFRNGDSDTCNFRCPSLIQAGKFVDQTYGQTAQDNLEYRWPELDNDGDCSWDDGIVCNDSALQRLFDFVFNCHPDFQGYKSKNGIVTSNNGVITILGNSSADTRSNRLDKFYKEMSHYMVKESFTVNGFITLVNLWTDQRGKNQFFTHYSLDVHVAEFTDDLNVKGQTYPTLRLLPYDIDTSLRGDNNSRLRYDFTRLYTDESVYNDGVSVLNISNSYYIERFGQTAGQVFINDRVTGRKSALYELLDWTCQEEYARYFSQLASNYLNADVLKRYCITNETQAFNAVIYNADTQYKYVQSGDAAQQFKAHGSAEEDLMWWINGRMYFMGGMFQGGDYMGTFMNGTMAMDADLDDTNKAMRSFTLRVKSMYRNYVGVKSGSGGKLQQIYAENPEQYYPISFAINAVLNEDSGRFNMYGQKFFADVEDFSKLYCSVITSWGGCTSMKTMKFGSNEFGFKNTKLASIRGTGSPIFGACTKVDLRNCTAFNDGDFTCFPVAEEILLEGCDDLTNCNLPPTMSLQVLHLPKNLVNLELQNKPNLRDITFESVDRIQSVRVGNVRNTTMNAVISNVIKKYLNS